MFHIAQLTNELDRIDDNGTPEAVGSYATLEAAQHASCHAGPWQSQPVDEPLASEDPAMEATTREWMTA